MKLTNTYEDKNEVPNGFWECPHCGAFVEDYQSTCLDCGYNKYKGDVWNQTYKTSNSTEGRKTADTTTGMIEDTGVNSVGSSDGLNRFFIAIAWIIWIGGLIASFFLGRSETYSKYTGRGYTYNIPLMIAYYLVFLVSGALSMAVARILGYLRIIADNTTRMKITLNLDSKK